MITPPPLSIETPSRPETVIFVADDARALVWRLGPIIEAFVAARHRVIGLVPRLARPDNLMLASLGVELRAPERPRSMLHRLAFHRDDEALVRDLAGDVIVGLASDFALDVMATAHRLGRCYTVLSAASDDFVGLGPERAAIPGATSLRERRWRSVLPHLSAVLVPTDEDRRRLQAVTRWPAHVPVHVAPLPGIQAACTDRVLVPTAAATPKLLLLPDPDDQRAIGALLASAHRVRRLQPAMTFALAAVPNQSAEHETVELVVDQHALDRALDEALAVVIPMSRNRVPPLTFEALRRGRALVVPATPLGRLLVDEPLNGVLVPTTPHHQWQQHWAAAMIKAAGLGPLAAAMARAGAQKAERGFQQRPVLAAAAQAFPERLRQTLTPSAAPAQAVRAGSA